MIFCFLPLHIDISTFGLTHPVSIFFNLTGIYLLFLYLEKFKLKNLFLSSIFLGCGTASRLTDGIIMLAIIYLYLIQSFKSSNLSKKLIIKRLITFLTLYSFIILISYLPMLLNIGIAQFKETLSVYYYAQSFRYFSEYSTWIIDILSFPGAIFLIAGLGYSSFHKNKSIVFFLLIWFFSLFIYYGSHHFAQYRYFCFAIIPLLIIQGYFTSKAFYYLRKIALLSVFILIASNFLHFYPIVKFRHDHNLQKEFAEFVRNNTNDYSYVIAMDEGPILEYYTDRKILYKPIGLKKVEFNEFFINIDMLLEKYNNVYIISSAIDGYDPQEYFRKDLSNNYNLEYIGGHLNQDWHAQSIYEQVIFEEKLFKLEKK